MRHPSGWPHTDGKCCVCGITREELEPKKLNLRCRCGHFRTNHQQAKGACIILGCDDCESFACDHTRCGWKPREEKTACEHPNKHCGGAVFSAAGEMLFYSCLGCGVRWEEEKPKPCTCGPDEACGDPCLPMACTCPPEECVCDSPEEPPMTPEEEEEAPEDCACGEPQTSGTVHRADGPCYIETGAPEDEKYEPCVCGAVRGDHVNGEGACYSNDCDCAAFRTKPEPPPQPDRRPPLAVAYSVQGHLYEVALSGDATVQAMDGALVITHHLGPIAGIVQTRPIVNEESNA